MGTLLASLYRHPAMKNNSYGLATFNGHATRHLNRGYFCKVFCCRAFVGTLLIGQRDTKACLVVSQSGRFTRGISLQTPDVQEINHALVTSLTCILGWHCIPHTQLGRFPI